MYIKTHNKIHLYVPVMLEECKLVMGILTIRLKSMNFLWMSSEGVLTFSECGDCIFSTTWIRNVGAGRPLVWRQMYITHCLKDTNISPCVTMCLLS
jgi:hypothetical protein